jgi:hypothetical protein
VSFWLLLPCAVVGTVMLRRRRVPITPLMAQFVVVTITAGAIYGLVRFRIPAEVSLVVLGAVALDGWWKDRAGAIVGPALDVREAPAVPPIGPRA